MPGIRDWLFGRKPLEQAAKKGEPTAKEPPMSMDQSYIRKQIERRHPPPASGPKKKSGMAKALPY